jgi:hypothetical protein
MFTDDCLLTLKANIVESEVVHQVIHANVTPISYHGRTPQIVKLVKVFTIEFKYKAGQSK